MGLVCSCRNGKNREVPNIRSRCNPSSAWSTAIHEGNLNEVKAIYRDKPISLNSRITMDGETALHIAVKRKDMQLIEFLLSHNPDVNIQSIKTGNTSLHEAALKQNVYILTMLIHRGADTQIRNLQNKKAKSLASGRQIKSMFKRINIERIRNQRSLQDLLQNPGDNKTTSEDVSLTVSASLPSGRELTINESYIGKIAEFDTDNTQTTELKPPETNVDIDGIADTDFAKEVGIELHEVIFFFQHLPDKAQFWDEIVGRNKDQITSSKELFKLIYALVFATMKIRHQKRKKAEGIDMTDTDNVLQKPASNAIKELTRILKQKIRRGREQFSLTKIQYIIGFNNYLYQMSMEFNCIVSDEELYDDTYIQVSDESIV